MPWPADAGVRPGEGPPDLRKVRPHSGVQAALIALTRSTFLKGGVTRKAMADLVRAAGPALVVTQFRGARFRVEGEPQRYIGAILLPGQLQQRDMLRPR